MTDTSASAERLDVQDVPKPSEAKHDEPRPAAANTTSTTTTKDSSTKKTDHQDGLAAAHVARLMRNTEMTALSTMSAVEQLSEVIMKWIKKQARRAAWEMSHANNATETALGVFMFACIYILGWTSGFNGAISASSDPDTFSAIPIMGALVMGMVTTWMIVIALAVIFLCVDAILVMTLFMNMDAGSSSSSSKEQNASVIPQAIRIAFSWLLNPRIFIAIGIAFVASFVFASIYVTFLRMKKLTSNEQRQFAARNVFIFNLALMFVLIVGQFVLDAYWKR